MSISGDSFQGYSLHIRFNKILLNIVIKPRHCLIYTLKIWRGNWIFQQGNHDYSFLFLFFLGAVGNPIYKSSMYGKFRCGLVKGGFTQSNY